MLFPIEKFPVHWIDGMKISKDHFVDSDNYVTDLVRDASSAFTRPSTYGLLPPALQANAHFDLQAISSKPNSITVTLKRCHAITIGGFKISIDSRQAGTTALSAELQCAVDTPSVHHGINWYDIVLIADPYHRKPIGVPSLEEHPPRHPHTDVQYALQIMPSDQISMRELGPYYFIVGKIKHKGTQLSIREDFIPPCASLESHEELMNFHAFCLHTIQHMQQLSFGIVRKIHEKNRPSSIAKNFQSVCQELLSYIAGIHFSLVNELPEQSPIKLVGCLSALAYKHHTALQCLPPEEREEFLKYLFEWTEVTPTEFEQILSSASTIIYLHADVYESLKPIQQYLKVTEAVWTKMASLEFIGQRKENMVVTKQTIQTKEEPPKKRWSILD